MTYGFNPPGIWGPNGRAFSQGVVAGEGALLYITGQVAWDENDKVVGEGDVAAQLEKCLDNTQVILEAAGGRLEDIVSLTIYFLDRAHLPAIQEVRRRHFKVENAPASILIQVSGLVIPEFLIEVVPVACIPHKRFKRPGK